jgi:hypothetical protein
MFYRKDLNGMVPVGDCVFVMAVGDASENSDLLKVNPDEYEHLRNWGCVAKMLQPVVCNGHAALDSAIAGKTFLDLAWYVGDNAEIKQNSFWDEAAIRKMCEPIGHGHTILLDQASLDHLASAI